MALKLYKIYGTYMDKKTNTYPADVKVDIAVKAFLFFKEYIPMKYEEVEYGI